MELLAFARGLRSMLMDNFLEIRPGGSRPHFPLVGLKKIPHAVDISGLAAAQNVSETSVRLTFFSLHLSGGCGGIDNHVDTTDGTGRPRR